MTIPSIEMNVNGFQPIPSPLAGTDASVLFSASQTGTGSGLPVETAKDPLSAPISSEPCPSQVQAPAPDAAAVSRFREAMAAPLAENARLQGVLNQAVRQIVRQPVDPKFVEALATAANLAPSDSPKEVVIEQGMPVVRDLPPPVVRDLPPSVDAEDVPAWHRVGTAPAPVVIEQSVPVAVPQADNEPDVARIVSAPRADREPSALPAVPETEVPTHASQVVSAPRADRGYSPGESDVPRSATVRPDLAIPVAVDETEREEEVAQTIVLPSPVQQPDVATVRVADAESTPPTVSPVAAERAQGLRGTELLTAIAGEVADAILVSPGLLRGQGEIRIQLRPDVLAGTEVRLEVTGRTLSVEFQPAVQDVAVLINQNLPQLQQQLATRIHAFDISVSVRSDVSVGRLSRRRER